VISGTWHVGWGDVHDPEKHKPLPAGSFHTEPAGPPHLVSTPDRETIVQVTGTGPTTAVTLPTRHKRRRGDRP
jgi:hypothetical protein